MNNQTTRFSLGLKIFAVVSSLLIFVITVATTSYLKISEVNQEVVDLSEYIIPITNIVSIIDVHVLEQELYLETLFKLSESENTDKQNFNKQLEKTEEKGRLVDEELEKALKIVVKAEQAAKLEKDRQAFLKIAPLLRKIEKEHQDFHDHILAIINEFQKGHLQKVHQLEEKLAKEETDFDEEIRNIYHQLEQFSKKASLNATSHQNSILLFNLIVTTIAVVLGILASFILTRSLLKPIKNLIGAMRAVGNGDYSVTVQVNTRDEIRSLADSFEQMVEELSLKEKIKEAFGKYVDPRVVENLIDQDQMQTSGEKRNMTVMFSQVDHFGSIVEKLEADEQIKATNQYLSLISKTISDCHGVLDKYIDTIVMAFWGTPFTTEEEHPVLACRAALKQKGIYKELADVLRTHQLEFDEASLTLHCGISSGQLVVGNIGAEQSKSYTVLGDTVNIASRLKGVAAQYQVPILISKETQDAAKDEIVAREIDLIQVVGKEEPVVVYEPLYETREQNEGLEKLKIIFEQGLTAYRQQLWDEALSHFSKYLSIIPNDGPSLVFIERITFFKNNPPGSDWKGVWTLTKK
ncbi:MAG: HAMP domain-containing protein [SAR324 cluster bacterium]|nr:HAMP domain-containing protein [SAR324 cluster bacterium]